MKHSLYVFLILFGLCTIFSQSTYTKPNDAPHSVLVTDNNKDGKVTKDSIANGEDYFLVRTNPATLPATAQIFHTKKGVLYISVSPEDLQNPSVVNKILVAKMSKSGNIKVLSLPNVGFLRIQTIQLPNGQKQTFITTDKGQSVSIHSVKYKAPYPLAVPPPDQDVTPAVTPAVNPNVQAL